MNRNTQLTFIISLTVIVFATGTFGYMILEHWKFMDALYMTVITLGTVGYGEVKPMTHTGKIFTIFLIITGVGFFAYVGSALVQFTVDGSLKDMWGRRRLEKQISKLKGHYIICGYGRIGRVLFQQLMTKISDIVVVEQDAHLLSVMEEDGITYVHGSSTEEKTLLKAGIKNAHGLVAVLGQDADNVFLVLTARQLNPNLYIVARACQEASKRTLIAAGADRVDSPYDVGAVRMAQAIIRPTVLNFLDYAFARKQNDIQMEEIKVRGTSELLGCSLQESGIRQQFNLILIAIQKKDGQMLFNPSSQTCLNEGDIVVALGNPDDLIAFDRTLSPK
ncbi:MAG: TrkA-N domain containing protein [Candidatus Magnetoglobus multicellularis str. Araruama]|uniref:TrkA-N domain containing protein n=1 Tax=Candidatus Magnetoglobus multicellularis str. Araruama TaxID=890399 RepID=A0A1V1PI32_9BACT|nr:MAG: TrkA-N domain containing protein [Candidatus Magnetoglobus multicellularis str. Araruama]